MSEVYVVTNPELGWNCIIGVFKCDDVSKTELRELFSNEDEAIIFGPLEVHKDTGEFQ